MYLSLIMCVAIKHVLATFDVKPTANTVCFCSGSRAWYGLSVLLVSPLLLIFLVCHNKRKTSIQKSTGTPNEQHFDYGTVQIFLMNLIYVEATDDLMLCSFPSTFKLCNM